MCIANIIMSDKAKQVPPNEILKAEALQFIHKLEPKCCAIVAYIMSNSVQIAIAHNGAKISYYWMVLRLKNGKIQYEFEGIEDSSKLPYPLYNGFGGV
jgi:hypothetical protein